ncbi:uncharacterized protein PGTG_07002 [Puccinia graminis f. sp. tritici CRL 75-36-700-3]|uniref:Uncharacterized protein n=1 Tax=Puccinia graminis f. sp. tritici (strain CRL 75-36-700-3 / race SCCL) TaxID=418459 RepID=E3KA90_PUCGT|nr:uncharacterized protein PGTG_07002 [Puccinia graminis f. sp. tritici CRL 75-36-700-3]EFP81381.2 hypothetical protein PGTG_07002 [Puccinia graminis f. sp. tritici CRL 75-36-700-3]
MRSSHHQVNPSVFQAPADLDCFRLAVEETRRSNSGNFLHNKNLQAHVAKQSNAVSFGPDPLDASCRRQLSSSVEREDLIIELDQWPSQTFSGLGLAGSPSIFNVSWHIPEDPLDCSRSSESTLSEARAGSFNTRVLDDPASPPGSHRHLGRSIRTLSWETVGVYSLRMNDAMVLVQAQFLHTWGLSKLQKEESYGVEPVDQQSPAGPSWSGLARWASRIEGFEISA